MIPTAYPTGMQPVCAAAIDMLDNDGIAEIHHATGHLCLKCVLYFVKRANPAGTRRQVHAVVANCEACQSIDPAPIKWQKGCLDVEESLAESRHGYYSLWWSAVPD